MRAFMSLETNYFYDFEDFRLDLTEKVLLRDGKIIPITPKVFETLRVMVENAGRLIEKNELMERIWHERFVEESNLTFNIKMLRRALGDNTAKRRFIETVPKRGYRFIAEVRRVEVEEEGETGRRGNTEKNISLSTDFSNRPPLSVPSPKGAVIALADWRRDESKPEESASGFAPKTPNGQVAKLESTSVTPLFKNKRNNYSYLLAGLVLVVVLLISAVSLNSWFTRGKSLEADALVLPASFSSEKLSTNGKVLHAIISPDGKNVVYTNGFRGKQSIWLRQLESTNNVEIIPPSDDVYGGLAFSPDSNFFYFTRRPGSWGGQLDIYRVSIFGGIPTKIVNEAQGWTSVSPDGGKISFVRCYYLEDENCSLWLADTDGSNERKLVSRPRPFRIGDNKISPDGKTVAFAVGQSKNAANEFGLVEVNIESGTERELTAQKFFNIKSLEWLPGQSGLLLAASRIPNKNFRLWQVSAVTGDASPLTKDSENYSALSLDKAAGVIVATQEKEDFKLFIHKRENPSEKRILADATTVVFAPNGKVIFSSPMSGNDEIWSINADGREQRQLTNDAADDSAPVSSPDNN
ncbi:MAG: winged helix-turn-helix domain-containing protein, partial [Pyrinomonadaceae bacterium]